MGESENEYFKKTNTSNEHFLPPDKHTLSAFFFWKFGVLCFLETPVLRFALLPYYRRFLNCTVITITPVFSAFSVFSIRQKSFELLFILLTDQISLPRWLYFLRCWLACALQLFVNQVVTSWNFKINLIFLIAPFFPHDQKVMTKSFYSA